MHYEIDLPVHPKSFELQVGEEISNSADFLIQTYTRQVTSSGAGGAPDWEFYFIKMHKHSAGFLHSDCEIWEDFQGDQSEEKEVGEGWGAT